MEIPIKIEVDSDDPTVCGKGCPFLRGDECLLFKESLYETMLEDGFEWNEDGATTDRCNHCLGIA